MSQATPAFAKPLKIGGLTLPHRIIMGSMHTGLEEDQPDLTRLAAFYVARAKGGAALIITGGVSPDESGKLWAHAATLMGEDEVPRYRFLTDAVHAAGGKIALQILHAGRYAKHGKLAAPSPISAPINKLVPRHMTEAEIFETIESFARCAVLAQQAGFDGIEIMGSEGYLINEFTCLRTNQRTDKFGGSLENRLRFADLIVRSTRRAVGKDYPIIYRLSALDLVEGGLNADEIAIYARAMEAAGADALDTGIGWHEARIPTIGHMVPRGTWLAATKRLKSAVVIPVFATNRIHSPEEIEAIISGGIADAVSMARPWLAEAEFGVKALANRSDEINTCIACNQACLDYVFRNKPASCVVNPRAGRETEIILKKALKPLKVAVVGGGAAGLSAALTAQESGHQVTLFESTDSLGGAMRYAAKVPGKEFSHTIRYYSAALARAGVEIHLNTAPTAAELAGFAQVIVTTGTTPRIPAIAGIDHPKVVSYQAVLSGKVRCGARVVVVGGGGIGVDTALFLAKDGEAEAPEAFLKAWKVDISSEVAGGLLGGPPALTPHRQVTICQRSTKPAASHAGPTTQWAVRAELQLLGIQFQVGVNYLRVDDDGLWVEREGLEICIPADHVVIAAGQIENNALATELAAIGVPYQLVGGAAKATELDALAAIEGGMRASLALA